LVGTVAVAVGVLLGGSVSLAVGVKVGVRVRVSVAVVVKVVVGEAVHVALTVGPAKVGVLVGITNTVGAAATPAGEGGAVIAK